MIPLDVTCRHKSVGGSSIQHLFPEKCRYGDYDKLFNEKVSGEVEQFHSFDCDRGNFLEELVLQETEKIIGEKISLAEDYTTHPKYPYMTGNADGILADRGIVEIKCPRSAKGSKIRRTGEIPYNYLLQIQYYMEIWDSPYALLVVWECDKWQPFILEIPRDQVLIDEILCRVKEFWAKVLKARKGKNGV